MTNPEYIKTGIFDKELSTIIEKSSTIRTESDYDDFFIATKNDAEIQLSNAEKFYSLVSQYIYNRLS